VVALVAIWVIAQPLRSSDSYSSAITAASRLDAGAALTDARAAAVEDPVSIQPLFLLARIYTVSGNPAAARHELLDAVSRQPSNPQSWQQLGCYDLRQHNAAATSELHRLLVLEPSQTQIQSDPAGFCDVNGG
jgi:predicted Zn-dependent protease